MEEELRFCEFLDKYPLPHRCKVTEGLYSPTDGGLEFSNGDVLHLYKKICEEVTLTFVSDSTNSLQTRTVSSSEPLHFQLQPRPPATFETVEDLLDLSPMLVLAGKEFIHPTDPEARFKAGDLMRLLRKIWLQGKPHLECRMIGSPTVINLPMNCKGQFRSIEDQNYYTISELIQIPVARRLVLAPGSMNGEFGVTKKPKKVVMQKPRFKVLLSSPSSPGQKMLISENTDITVSPREATYMGHLERDYILQKFVSSNKHSFPVQAVVTNWKEQTKLLETFSVQPGSSLGLHRVVAVPKYLLEKGDQFFVVPADYRGVFVRTPRRFEQVYDLVNLGPMRIKVLEAGRVIHPDLDGLQKGMLLEVLTGNAEICRCRKRAMEEQEVLFMTRVQPLGPEEEVRTLKVPVYLTGTFEEVLREEEPFTVKDLRQQVISEKVQFVSEVEEVTVGRGTARKSRIHMAKDQLPKEEEMDLSGPVNERCVSVTIGDKGIDLPIRTRIYLEYQKDINSTPFKKSPLTRGVIEPVSEEVYRSLQRQLEKTTLSKPAPPLPRRQIPIGNVHRPVKGCRKPLPKLPDESESDEPEEHLSRTPPLYDIPRPLLGADLPTDDQPEVKSRREQLLESLANTVVPPPPVDGEAGASLQPRRPASETDTHRYVNVDEQHHWRKGTDRSKPAGLAGCGIQGAVHSKPDRPASFSGDPHDYEEIEERPTCTPRRIRLSIPVSGDLSHFDSTQMLEFLRQMNAPLHAIQAWQAQCITGTNFGVMNDSHLESYGLLDNPWVVHFRDSTSICLKTRRHRALELERQSSV